MREEWRPVPGFRNYSVSNTGKVRNENTGALLSIARKKDSRRYCPVVRLFSFTGRYELSIGKLVWSVFKGPVPPKHVIRCKVDGNFALKNLECVPRYMLATS